MDIKRSSVELRDKRSSVEFIEKRSSFEFLDKKSVSSIDLRDRNNVELRDVVDTRVSAEDLLYVEHREGSVSPSEGPKTIGDIFKNLRLRTSSGDVLLERWKAVSSLTLEPRREKTCFCHIRITKAQISLRICAV